MTVACQIAAQGLNCGRVCVGLLVYVNERQFLYDAWGEFGGVEELEIAKLDLIRINFGHFQCIDFTRVLVNNVDHVL